ncbi:MAG: DUF1810 domain-containing protein [Chitinophagaceae bacterium]|nr:DUF1810 domain-containing protein [Chitinophagaceae bacterium]
MTHSSIGLQRFIDAQQPTYETALAEIRAGRKRTHWMWYVFPQVAGLGLSETSRYFAITSLQEAREYLEHPLLGKRLIEITSALLDQPDKNARNIFGSPDDQKLHSSMTLFSLLPGADPVFRQVIDEYFNGINDERTVRLIVTSI